MQIAGSIDRELAEGMILKNKGRKARMDIDLVGWQKRTIQHEIGSNFMQKEWDVFAGRCQQTGDGKIFEACKEPKVGEETGISGDQAQEHEGAQTEDRDGEANGEGPLHPVVEGLIKEALGAIAGEEAWLAIRRAARMSRAQWSETLGTVACEIRERWGRVADYMRANGDIKAVCEQEGFEENGAQDEGRRNRGDSMRKIAGDQPLTYLDIISHQYRNRYQELVEQNTKGQGDGWDGSDEPKGEESCQEPPTPIAGPQDGKEEGEQGTRVWERPIDEEADAEPFYALPEPPVWQDEEQEPPQEEGEVEVLGMADHAREEDRKGRKDMADFKGEIDWELSTGLYRSSNKGLTEDQEEGEAMEGEIDYDDMGEALTREQTDMLRIVIGGAGHDG